MQASLYAWVFVWCTGLVGGFISPARHAFYRVLVAEIGLVRTKINAIASVVGS